ncbi:SDR family NAD(P)-dependent oxidoreductase [Rhodococcus oryzae]|uniref:SDR family NAD(P)-dependent oxidoreductase n=1 Tax=Rhodococcus oryzae TaxID=2571143 RepID=UPI0037A67B63
MPLSTSDADLHDVVDMNLGGAFNTCKAEDFPLVKRFRGSITNISAVPGKHGNVGQTNYSASKAGVIGFTKSLAKEVGRYWVRANAIAPGSIETGMTSTGQRVGPQFTSRTHPAAPMGRRRVGELPRVPQIRIHDCRCLPDRRRPVAVTSPSPLYFNLRCLYSSLALKGLAAGYRQIVDTLQWRPYWDPDDESIAAFEQACGRFAYSQMLRERHFYILEGVNRLACGSRIDGDLAARPRLLLGGATPSVHRSGAERENARTSVLVEPTAVDARQEHLRSRHCGRAVSSLQLIGPKLAGAEADPANRESRTQILLGTARDRVIGVSFFVRGRARYVGVEPLDVNVADVGCRGTADVETTHPDCGPAVPSVPSATQRTPMAVDEASHAGDLAEAS